MGKFGAQHFVIIFAIALVAFVVAGRVSYTRDLANIQKKA